MPGIDREAPIRFLDVAFQPDDWAAILLKSYETDRAIQLVGPVAGLKHPRFQAWLRAKNSERYNVYVSVNAIQRGRRSRTRASIGAIRHVFLEVDEGGADILARVEARGDLPPVSYVLRTSPGRVHLFWKAEGLSVDRAEALQRQLARELGTDRAATSAAQMTRLPGFLNHKRQPPYGVVAHYQAVEAFYNSGAFPAPSIHGMHPIDASPISQPTVGPAASREEARKYLAETPPAIGGERGDYRTYLLCRALVWRFRLDDEGALQLLAEWNVRCAPPWPERDLLRKLRRARQGARRSRGDCWRLPTMDATTRQAGAGARGTACCCCNVRTQLGYPPSHA